MRPKGVKMNGKHIIIKWTFLLVVPFTLLIVGCSQAPTKKVPNDNRRKQVQMQRVLRKLNRENEKLRDIVKEASVLNEETGKVIGNNLVTKENLPEMQKLLDDFKQVNQETDRLLIDYQRSLEKDIEKNRTLEEMLNGFADECERQTDRKNKMKRLLAIEEDSQINFQSGIAALRVTGLTQQNNISYAHNGYAGSYYFTYLGDNNLVIGLRAMTLQTSPGDASSDTLDTTMPDSPSVNSLSTVGALSFGFIIRAITSVNIVPQFLYGVGTTIISQVDGDNSDSGDVVIQGFELPININLGRGFSFGLRMGAYQLMSNYTEARRNGAVLSEFEAYSTDSTLYAMGLNIGASW